MISSIIGLGKTNTDNNLNISLVKMDSQGFECQILEGFDQNLADKIQKVKFEVAGKYLRAQGC